VHDHTSCCSAATHGTTRPGWERRALLVAAAAGASCSLLGGPALAVAPRHLDRRGRLLRTVELERRRTFTGLPGEGDWHYVPFDVPKGVRAIEVELDYEPLSTGLGFTANVVDLGLLDPDGFRGWSGGARRSFRVTRGEATPGYLPGRVVEGTWQVALGPFAVVPPGVEATLRIRLVPGPPGPAYVPAPPARRVAGRGRGWYAGDLHVHTDHSDGSPGRRAPGGRRRARLPGPAARPGGRARHRAERRARGPGLAMVAHQPGLARGAARHVTIRPAGESSRRGPASRSPRGRWCPRRRRSRPSAPRARGPRAGDPCPRSARSTARRRSRRCR